MNVITALGDRSVWHWKRGVPEDNLGEILMGGGTARIGVGAF